MSTVATTPPRPPLGLRTLIAVQFTLAGVAILGFAAVYLAGLARAGSHAALVGLGDAGPFDPKDGIPFGFHPWNPFTWLYMLIVLAVATGWVPAAFVALFGGAMLANPAVRAHRRLWRLLLGGSLACALFVALLFLPPSSELLVWFAD